MFLLNNSSVSLYYSCNLQVLLSLIIISSYKIIISLIIIKAGPSSDLLIILQNRKCHLLSLRHCLFLFLLRNLLMDIRVIQLVKVCILADLVIKRNHHGTAFNQSHTGCGVGYETKLGF